MLLVGRAHADVLFAKSETEYTRWLDFDGVVSS